MSRFGLVGPSYASQSPNLDAEFLINWYPELDESGAGNAPIALMPTPGTKIFASLLTAISGAGNGTVDNVQMNSGNSNMAAAAGASVANNETALYISECPIGGNPGALVPPTGWTHIDDPDAAGQSSMYAKPLAVPTAINETQVLGGGAGRWATALVFFGSATGVIPVFFQNTTIVSGAFTVGPFSNPFPGAVTAGNGIFVVMCIHTTNVAPVNVVFSDNRGGVYSIIGQITSGSGATIVLGWAPNAVGGVTTVTYNAGAFNGSGTIKAYEVGGIGPVLVSNGPVRGEEFINGRAFAVSGNGFFELFANGTFTNWGTVANDALPVTMAASPQQLLLASAGTAYVFDLMLNTLTAIAGATFPGPVAQAGICDDFFLLTIQNSKEFFVSAPLNATDWVTNGSAIVSVFPDNIVSMFVFQRQIWFYSDTQSVVYYDSGNIFPFDVNPNAFIEAGCAAENGATLFNNSIGWIGADARGQGKIWIASGYTPSRISNHAVEFAIQSYTRIDDAVGFSYQDQGHEFLCFYFPTPSVTWCYDAMTGMWHQRGFFVQAIGQFRAAHYQNHMFAFGKHLVGDWQSGNVYQINIPVALAGAWDFATDAGNPIRRVRRAPHVSREQKHEFHIELQVYVETGLGPQPPLLDGAGKARDPQLMLSWSDDGGHTFGNEHILNCGQAGQFKKRARKLQLGRARDRVYQIAVSDPVPWRVVDGYLQIVAGTGI